MNKLQQRVQQRGQGGFTLIELLVVIAILAILAGVVVFAVGNSTDNAKLSACKTESASLATAASAAKTANLVNDSGAQEDIFDYLDKADLSALNSSLEFFTVGGTLASGTAGVSFTGNGNPTGCDVPTAVTP